MKNAKYFHGSSFWVGTLAILGLFMLALPNSDVLAAPAKRNVSFDHVKTGFPLTGAHVTLPCETCHIQGTFKGTPKKCATCHTQGSRIQTTTFKPSNHIVTAQACEQCHRSTASWSVVFFSHAGVTPHQCIRCHNSSIAKGKSANHMPTSEPCDACHRTTTWMSASFTHVSVMPGSCAQCHIQGGTATAKSPSHIPTNLPCDACHTTGGSFLTSRFTHSATQGVMAGQCASSGCHDGTHTSSNAQGKAQASPTHITTTASCDTCHTGYATFAGANQHVGVIASAGTCANAGCHAQGGKGLPKPSGNSHIPVGALTCNICHNMTTFNPSTFNHSPTQGVVTGQCATCHNNNYAALNVLPKPNDHIPTGLACDQCHNMTSFTASSFTHTPALGVMAGQCASSGCHDGTHISSNAEGKPGNHPVTSASCDTCHTGYATFAGLSSKPADHIPTTLACSACHTGSNYSTSSFTHSASQGVNPGQCLTCHNGTYIKWNALAKPANHIPTNPTNLSCDACHTTGGTFTTSRFTHSTAQGVVTGQCSTCHSGSYVQWNVLGKPSNHIITSASCDQCHTGFSTFAGANNHAGVIASAGTCANAGCHAPGGAGLPKPTGTGHIPTNLTCNWCHNMTTFTPSSFTHSATQGVMAGQCESCHNGTYAGLNVLGKAQAAPPHITTTASCDTCHTGYATFAGGRFSHTGVSPGTCSSCHYQGGPGMAKSSNHIPYESQLVAGSSMNCDSCHKSTNPGGFATQTMNHNNSLGNGSGWCKGCHASGTNYGGGMERKSLTHEKSTGVTDCSQSGCHRPLGTKGSTYNNWN